MKHIPIGLLITFALLPFRLQPEPGCPNGYGGFLPPRLQVGESARVVAGGVPNRLRDQPRTGGTQVGMAAPESLMMVIGGPVCDPASGIIWWQVQQGSITGWTAEGFAPDEYFLEPVSEAGIARGMTAVARATVNSVETANAAETAVIVDATSTEQARLETASILPILTMTAQALITPSATFTPSVTPTITPTPEPVLPLPETRQVITPDNLDQLTPLTSQPFGAGSIFFLPDSSQVLFNGFIACDLPSMATADHFGDFPLSLGPVVAMSPDGRYFAFMQDRVVSVFDSSTGESRQLPGAPFLGTSIVISSGPNYTLAIAQGEAYANPELPVIRIYDLATNTEVFTLENNAVFGAQLAFNRDGSRLATTGAEIRLISTRDARWIIPTPGFSNGDIAYRPLADSEAEQIAFGGGSGVILFDLGRGTARSYAITGAVTGGSIAFSPDGRLMAVVGIEVHGVFDSTPPRFNLFDVQTGDLLMDTDEYLGAFAFSPDGTLLVVSGGGRTRILGIQP